ncbi:MAG: arginine--tRNA ligase [Thermoplasmata archaeon]
MATSDPSDLTPDPDPWSPILRDVLESLADSLGGRGIAVDRTALEEAIDRDGGPQGDLALPVHRLAARAGIPPAELAAAVAAGARRPPGIAAIAADGAFVNVRVATERLAKETLGRIAVLGERYGGGPATGRTANVEHTSANPTGPLHVGRVRNGIIGDTLARVLRALGHSVTTQYYVDDLGRQAAMITWIWSKPPQDWPAAIAEGGLAPPGTPEEKADRRFGRPYPLVSAYLKEHPEAQAEVQDLVQRVESGEAPPNHRELAASILGGMLATLARIGIRFDSFVWESSLLTDGEVDAILRRLDALPSSVEEANGARALDLSRYGLPKESDRVVYRRGNGTSLYVTRDVAYHLQKLRSFDRVIDVFGQDHRLHARTLDAFLQELGEPRRPEFILYQDITSKGGGRMSTRGGSAVWLDDLLDEAVARARTEVRRRWEGLPDGEVDAIAEAVGTGAVRFHIVRVAPEKPVAFSWEEALSFEGRSGPFVQYAYARAGSILRKAGVEDPYRELDPSRLTTEAEGALLRVVARLPRVLRGIGRTHHVHALASYAHELADEFNRFYHAVPVLSSGAERASRIALVAGTRTALGRALDLLGIERLERM